MIAGILSLIGCGAPEPTGELLSVDYTHSGTMAGYIYEGRVKQDSNGNYVLTAMKENYGPLFQKQISKEAMDTFKQIIIEEKMYRYKERYLPRMEVLDGYGWHFAAQFSDGTRIYSYGSNAWPRGNGLGRIQGYLLSLIADADSIVEESEED
ncbi:MAG: hypothetical protein J6X46_08160 [Prevotella sp.]|nr:hypothetical protein [Prevotella sp.]